MSESATLAIPVLAIPVLTIPVLAIPVLAPLIEAGVKQLKRQGRIDFGALASKNVA